MTVPLIAAPLGAILAKSSGITLDPIAKPIAAVLAFFYALIPNFGIAIVLLTVAMMIVLTPLTIKQTRSMLVMQKLQPELKRLQEQHKNDRQALNEAVMALYREHNASPLGGCLPMLSKRGSLVCPRTKRTYICCTTVAVFQSAHAQ